MTLKFNCPCGTRIGFDVEPENGRMPMALACPECGADLTAIANGEIAAQTPSVSAEPSPKPSMRIVRHPEALEAASAPKMSAPANVETAEPASTLPTATRASGRPPAPRERDEPKPPGFLARHGFRLAGIAVTAALGYWVWFATVGSKPRALVQMEAPSSAPFLAARFLDADRLLVLTPTRLAVKNLAADTEVWGVAIQAPERRKRDERRRVPDSDEVENPDYTDYEGEAIPLHTAGKSAWIRLGTNVLQFDLASGKRGASIPLPDVVLEESVDPNGWLLVTRPFPLGPQFLTRVDFASAKAETYRFTPPRIPVRPLIEGDDSPKADPLVIATVGNTLLQARLLEQALVPTGKAGEAESGRTALEKENLRAADSGEVAGDFLRRNSGGGVEDLSKYEVTLTRPFGGAAWKGTVSGRPLYVPLVSVDLLFAGKQVTAFDRSGNRLWQAALGSSIAQRHLDAYGAGSGAPPAFETGGRIYVLDRTTVHALSPRNGEAAWRLPTVGASEVVAAPGALYVATTSAGPEDANLDDLRDGKNVRPLLLSVDPATGAVRWQAEWVADHASVSGPYLFGWRAGTSALDELSAAMNQGTARSMLHLSRLDPAKGSTEWTWHRKGSPQRIEAIGNRILIHRPREITVLGFRTW
jgi:hypothetical protein